MIRLTVTIKAPSSVEQSLLEALQYLRVGTHLERGCLHCAVWTEADATIHYLEEWESEAALACHVRSQRFTSLLAVIAPNLPCKPNTMMFNKVTINDARQAVQMFGPAQHAVAMAVQDSVAEGIIPADEADDLFICVGVFIHWDAADDAKIQDFNYRATKEALERAVAGEPRVGEVVAKRDQVKHPFAA